MSMNANKIYVGNLPYQIEDDEVKEAFTQFGNVQEINLIRDRYSNECKGFGFITFETDEAAESALTFNGEELKGRRLKVNIARERTGGGGAGGRRRPSGGNGNANGNSTGNGNSGNRSGAGAPAGAGSGWTDRDRY